MSTPMTRRGAEALRAELEFLKRNERPRITRAIAEARAHGDLKENAEYHAAREQQAFVEGRIKEIEAKLADAQIIDVSKIEVTGRVVFGVTVTLVEITSGEERRLEIVGEDEADIKAGRVSVMSPLARALIGKEEGEVVVVETPSGSAQYEISLVEHISA